MKVSLFMGRYKNKSPKPLKDIEFSPCMGDGNFKDKYLYDVDQM